MQARKIVGMLVVASCMAVWTDQAKSAPPVVAAGAAKAGAAKAGGAAGAKGGASPTAAGAGGLDAQKLADLKNLVPNPDSVLREKYAILKEISQLSAPKENITLRGQLEELTLIDKTLGELPPRKTEPSSPVDLFKRLEELKALMSNSTSKGEEHVVPLAKSAAPSPPVSARSRLYHEQDLPPVLLKAPASSAAQ